MKSLVLAVSLVCVGLATRDAAAQSFWYVPPGYADGYYYGLNFGSGVGFGYGVGVGVPLTPQAVNASTTPPWLPPQYFGELVPPQSVGAKSLYVSSVPQKLLTANGQTSTKSVSGKKSNSKIVKTAKQ